MVSKRSKSSKTPGDLPAPIFSLIRYGQVILAFFTVALIIFVHLHKTPWVLLFNLTPAAFTVLWIMNTLLIYSSGHLGLVLLQTTMDGFIGLVTLVATVFTTFKKPWLENDDSQVASMTIIVLGANYVQVVLLIVTTAIGYKVHKSQLVLKQSGRLVFGQKGGVFAV